jgi:hypothetical protein
MYVVLRSVAVRAALRAQRTVGTHRYIAGLLCVTRRAIDAFNGLGMGEISDSAVARAAAERGMNASFVLCLIHIYAAARIGFQVRPTVALEAYGIRTWREVRS